jgi:hypothetical protein
VNISVHIERLVLDGIEVPYYQRPLLQAAVEGELVRLLARGGVAMGLMAGGAVPSLPGGAIHLAEGNDPTYLGTQIARAVHGGIGG